jgi:putative hydrolase of the HAD superfamily
MSFTTLFFDLDDTLYPSTNGLWGAIRVRMEDYMRERMGLPSQGITSLRRSYFETYGTTLRGLQRHHQVDAYDFLSYVHDLPLEEYLQPDPEIRELLLSLPQSKWIFTNADAAHSRRVLEVLRLADLFDGIADIHARKYSCKPELQAYQLAMELAGESLPQNCVFLDDSPRNLLPARQLGFRTILVGSSHPDPSAHFAIPDLKELPRAVPELWPTDDRLNSSHLGAQGSL